MKHSTDVKRDQHEKKSFLFVKNDFNVFTGKVNNEREELEIVVIGRVGSQLFLFHGQYFDYSFELMTVFVSVDGSVHIFVRIKILIEMYLLLTSTKMSDRSVMIEIVRSDKTS